MADDRGTKIYNDQIADHTITPDELDEVNSPNNRMTIIFTDEGSGNPRRFKWKYLKKGGIRK